VSLQLTEVYTNVANCSKNSTIAVLANLLHTSLSQEQRLGPAAIKLEAQMSPRSSRSYGVVWNSRAACWR